MPEAIVGEVLQDNDVVRGVDAAGKRKGFRAVFIQIWNNTTVGETFVFESSVAFE